MDGSPIQHGNGSRKIGHKMNPNRIRSKFARAMGDVIVYREQEEGYADDPRPLPAGGVVYFCEKTETMTLNGERVEAILFKIGTGSDWFFMPKAEFMRSMEPHRI
jgi:hypothetical protein